MPTNVLIIHPNLVLQKNDPMTTGVVYMPLGAVSLAAQLRTQGIKTQIIDAFGESPNSFTHQGNLLVRGLTPDLLLSKIESTRPDLIFIYAYNLTAHAATIQLLQAVRKKFASTFIGVFENTQAVTAYSLKPISDEFFQQGADFVLTGEPEESGISIARLLDSKSTDFKERLEKVPGVIFRSAKNKIFGPDPVKISDLDSLAFPAWDLIPVQNYWELGYAHGPLSSKKYLPILTSRGCPYNCGFCVIPSTNQLKWRSRSAKSVVDEIEQLNKKFGVDEFHVEDVDPTVNDKRTQEFSKEIISRNLKITWKICSGTKVETIKSEETVRLMAQSGCSYISISPESGSARLMKLINKPFNYDHALRMISYFNSYGIYSQACFVLGYPEETDEDRKLTFGMVRDLTRRGVDEIAVFIVTPVPGSKLFDRFEKMPSDYSRLNFSPDWRLDYKHLNRQRLKLYFTFLFFKMIYHPIKFFKQPFRFLTRNFQTKMEMVPFRALATQFYLRFQRGQ